MKTHIVTIKKYDQEGQLQVNQYSYKHKSIAQALIKMSLLTENPLSITYKWIGRNRAE